MGTMPVARIAIEPEALIGVSGKLNISGALGFAAAAAGTLSDDDAPCPEFRFAKFEADEPEDAGALASGDAPSFAGVWRTALASLRFAPLAAGIVQR
jgi:hypothetical protein